MGLHSSDTEHSGAHNYRTDVELTAPSALRIFFMHSLITLAFLLVTSGNKTTNFSVSIIVKYNNSKMS